MECHGGSAEAGENYFLQLSDKVFRHRIPLNGSIDLTSRCNLRCVHCYAGPQTSQEGPGGKEMETSRILDIVDQMTAAGCLFMLLTGGEPLLHKDFMPIYRHMKSKGLVITLFTNAVLIDDAIADLFAELPPHSVEVSIYGATEATSEKITGVNGALGRCLTGIKRLTDRGFRHIQLKTILMTLNSNEFYEIEKIAADLGLDFRMDATIFPRLNGDRSPLVLRVSPEEAVEKEFSSDKRLQGMQKYFERMKGQQQSDDRLYICGAGVNSFHIDAHGNLMPCMMPAGISYDLAGGSFADGWNKIIHDIMKLKAGENYPCAGCEKISICGFCPAFFRLDSGSEYVKSDYMCAVGSRRLEMICGDKNSGGIHGDK